MGVGDIIGKNAHNRPLGTESKATRSHHIDHVVDAMGVEHHLKEIDDALGVVAPATLTRATLHLNISMCS